MAWWDFEDWKWGSVSSSYKTIKLITIPCISKLHAYVNLDLQLSSCPIQMAIGEEYLLWFWRGNCLWFCLFECMKH